MEMTESEIIRKFERNGKDPEQIKILAELNCVPKYRIVEILSENGCTIGKKKKNNLPKIKFEITREIEDNILTNRSQGLSYSKISEKLDIPRSVVAKVIQEQRERFTI